MDTSSTNMSDSNHSSGIIAFTSGDNPIVHALRHYVNGRAVSYCSTTKQDNWNSPGFENPRETRATITCSACKYELTKGQDMATPKKTLRIFVNRQCDRDCNNCRIVEPSNVSHLHTYTPEILRDVETIWLTGGEPLLKLTELCNIITTLKSETNAPVYVDTAKTNPALDLLSILELCDGINVSLHRQSDVPNFRFFATIVHKLNRGQGKRLHLSAFKEANFNLLEVPGITDWSFQLNLTTRYRGLTGPNSIVVKWPTY